MTSKLKDIHIIALLTILFIALVAFPRILHPEFDHGDEFSDASMLVSGKNFVKFGFIRCKFLSFYDPHLTELKDPYTHVPPMSDITNAMLRKIFKTDSLTFFRGVSLFFSLLNILLWYLFVKRFSNSSLLGFLAALFYFTNPYFIYGADSLYQNAYSDFLRAAIFLIFLYTLTSPQKRRTGLIILFLLFALETAYTFEYIVYLGLFMFVFRYFYLSDGRKLSMKYIFLLSLAPVIILLLHFLKNAWYVGSFSQACLELKNVVLIRIARSHDSPIALTISSWWQYVFLRNVSLAYIFNFSILIPFASFFGLLYYNLPTENKIKARRIFLLCLLLFICGISWYIIFPSHSLAHTFITFLPRHLVPAAALSFALCGYIMYHFSRNQSPRGFLSRLPLIALVIAVSVSGILKSELPVPGELRFAAKEFLKFKQCLLQIKAGEEDRAALGVNYYRYPFISYYANRKCFTVFSKDDLEKLRSLPEYFILIPNNNPVTHELFLTLKEKYEMLFQCDSARFPSFFMKLKGSGKS
ncbi:MAG: hypothetical protein ABIH75_01585 [Candidatus Omnitrophota bacterium]